MNWGRADLGVPWRTHPRVPALCLPLSAQTSFNAKCSHVWAKDRGEYVSMAKWSQAVQQGTARSLDGDVRLTHAQMIGRRGIFAKLGESHTLIN